MKPDEKCYDLIKSFEGYRADAYQDQAGIWTIGWGTTRYINGDEVQFGQIITPQKAEQELQFEVNQCAIKISKLIKKDLTQNQFNALVSFAYNAGIGALQGSTLLKRVNIEPWDPTIRDAFMMWTKIHVDGKLVQNKGLQNRRTKEADLYFLT